MSDKQKVLVTLTLLSETCTASIALLEQPPSPQPSVPPLSILRKDFLSLLTLIYTSTTKVSLTLRPSAAAYSACLAPLQDIVKHVNALTTCATLFDSHGLTYAKQVRGATKDVLQSVHTYATAFLDLTQRGDASEEDYLVRTGTVHDAVEQVRRDLPTDNLGAVRFLWAKDREMLDDSLNDVNEMIEGGDAAGDEDDLDEEDDDWDELGFGSTKKMSETELERTKKIQPLLRMSILLHKRIHIDLLKRPRPEASANVLHASIDALPGHSHTFLLSVEELVAALYAPQNMSALRTAVVALTQAAAEFKPPLEASQLLQSRSRDPQSDPVQELQDKLADTAIEETPEAKKQREIQKWFDTCFQHVASISQKALASL